MAMRGGALLRVLAYGDSLTAGLTSFAGGHEPFALVLEHELRRLLPNRVQVDYHGFPGASAADMAHGLHRKQFGLAHFLKKATDEGAPYDTVLLWAGANDDLLQGALTDLLPSLQALHTAVRSAGAASVALGLHETRMSAEQPGLAEKLREVNRQIEASSGASVYVDTARLVPFDERSGHFGVDGVHMSASGYQLLGKGLAQALLPHFEERAHGHRSAAERPGSGVGGGPEQHPPQSRG